MKTDRASALIAFVLSGFFMVSPVVAETKPAAETSPNPESSRIYGEAINLMNRGEMDASLKKIDELLALDPGSAPALNLKGAVLVRQKNFDGAQAAFSSILEKDPQNAIAVFNLAEVFFLRKDYAKGRELFQKFMQVPGNEQNALARYKVYLCELLGADPASAQKTLEELKPTISNPFYYFAHAGDAFKKGKPAEGREFIQSAFGIYPGGMNAAFADSMVELGWIKQEEIASIGAIDASALSSLSQEFQPEASAAPKSPIGFENVLPDFATGGEKKKSGENAPKP